MDDWVQPLLLAFLGSAGLSGLVKLSFDFTSTFRLKRRAEALIEVRDAFPADSPMRAELDTALEDVAGRLGRAATRQIPWRLLALGVTAVVLLVAAGWVAVVQPIGKDETSTGIGVVLVGVLAGYFATRLAAWRDRRATAKQAEAIAKIFTDARERVTKSFGRAEPRSGEGVTPPPPPPKAEPPRQSDREPDDE